MKLLVVAHACLRAVNRTVYRHLAQRGYELRIVVPSRFGGETCDAERPGDPPLIPLRRAGASTRFHGYRGLEQELRKFDPDIVLLDLEPDSVLAFQAGLWTRRHRRTLVIQSCENLPQNIMAWWCSGLRKQALKNIFTGVIGKMTRPLVDHVFSISSAGVEVMRRAGYEGRVTRIPLGVDTELFRPDARVREDVRTQIGAGVDPVIAYFGRQIPQKGIHILFEALGGLMHRPWTLLLDAFQANNAYAVRLQDIATRGKFTGRIREMHARHDEVPRFMNAADIVVAPSLTTPDFVEQYGRVVPEAMACGRTVIVSDSGALPEVLGCCGLVVPEGDPATLRTSLEGVMSELSLREELGRRALARVEEHLSISRQVTIMDSVFHRLVTKPAMLTVGGTVTT